MLLTSSQVSIAASSSVVIFFTTALFLSGYAIQQRTLRDLREAIKPSPRPKPQIFLPDRFRATTTELQDGTVVVVDADVDPSNAYRPPRPDGEQQQVVVEITPSVADDERGEVAPEADGARAKDEREEAKQPITKDEQRDSEEQPDEPAPQKKDAKVKRPKKISRAERRRQIKEEIQRLAQGDRKGIWQPRLW